MAGWLQRVVTKAMRKADKIDPIFQPLPGRVVRIAVMVFTLIAVLNRFGVETTSLIALLGAAGLAIGLAPQGTQSVCDRPRQAPYRRIKVEALGDSSVNILFRVWTERADWWATKMDLIQRCKVALEAGGISIPFPQRDVHVSGGTASS